MYTMLQEYGGKVLPSDQVSLDDTREVGLAVLALVPHRRPSQPAVG